MNQMVQGVLNDLTAELSAGAGDWQKSWKTIAANGIPTNALTKKNYNGANILRLWITGMKRGYASNKWATYKQWLEYGTHVKKDEKGTPIIFYKTIITDRNDDGQTTSAYSMMRIAWVFNATQTQDWNEPPHIPLTEEQRHQNAQMMFDKLNINLAIGEPAYISSLDQITMPPKHYFDNLDEYYTTYAHEIVHWTGHKSRLDRLDRTKNFDKSIEELVAELGSMFIDAHLGLCPSKKSHAAYIQAWMKTTDEKTRTANLMRAASMASKAFEYIMAVDNKERLAA